MLEGSDVLKNYLNILRRAQEGKYAIPAFNYSDIWELEAILEAAAEERAEVYVASNMRTVNTLGIKYLGALGEKAYEHYEGHVLIIWIIQPLLTSAFKQLTTDITRL